MEMAISAAGRFRSAEDAWAKEKQNLLSEASSKAKEMQNALYEASSRELEHKQKLEVRPCQPLPSENP